MWYERHFLHWLFSIIGTLRLIEISVSYESAIALIRLPKLPPAWSVDFWSWIPIDIVSRLSDDHFAELPKGEIACLADDFKQLERWKSLETRQFLGVKRKGEYAPRTIPMRLCVPMLELNRVDPLGSLKTG